MWLIWLVLPALRRNWGKMLSLLVQFLVGSAVVSMAVALAYHEGDLIRRARAQFSAEEDLHFARMMPSDPEPPGVGTVTLVHASWRPMTVAELNESDGRLPTARAPWESGYALINPEYTQLVQPSLSLGRWLAPADWHSDPVPVVINAAAARLMFPNRNPLGQIFGTHQKMLVVGVLAPGEPLPVRSDANLHSMMATLEPLIIASRSLLGAAPDLQEAMVSRNLWIGVTPPAEGALEQSWTLADAIAKTQRMYRGNRVALYAVAGFLITLATLGFVGVMLSLLEQRWRELGIRAALGASLGKLVAQLWTEMAVVLSTGGLIGGVLGVWLASLLPGGPPRMLWQVPILVLLSMAALASIVVLLPLWRLRRFQIDEAIRGV